MAAAVVLPPPQQDSQFLRRLHEYPLVHSTTRVLGNVYGLGKAYLPLVDKVESALVSSALATHAAAHTAALDSFGCAQLDRFEAHVVAPAHHALDTTVSTLASVEHALAALAYRVVDAADAAVEHLPKPAAAETGESVFAAAAAAAQAAQEEKDTQQLGEGAEAQQALGAETLRVLHKARRVGGKARARVLEQAARPVHAVLATPAAQTVTALPATVAARLAAVRARSAAAAAQTVAASMAAGVETERLVLRATTNLLERHPAVASTLTAVSQLPGCRAVVAYVKPWLPTVEPVAATVAGETVPVSFAHTEPLVADVAVEDVASVETAAEVVVGTEDTAAGESAALPAAAADDTPATTPPTQGSKHRKHQHHK